MSFSRNIPNRLAAVMIALVAGICALAFTSQAHAATTLSTLGVYTGSGNVAGLDSFETTIGGDQPGYVLEFLPGDSWSTIEDPDWYVNQWKGTGAQVVLSVPMLPSSGATLATGATGAYDQYFKVLAQRLVADGDGSGVLRLGWEFNGNWFPWSIQNGNAANYASYWRQIVTTMRAVAPNLRFDWTANSGSSYSNGVALNPEAAYPGDAYVNYIGMDQYDESYVSDPSVTANRWNGYVNQQYGLAWQRSFAAAHGKQVTFPEWGLDANGSGYGGGDSPAFIQDMYNWFASSNLAYQIYFDVNAGDGDHLLSDYPNAAAEYDALFVSTTAVSTSTGTTATTTTTSAPTTTTSGAPASTTSTTKTGTTTTTTVPVTVSAPATPVSSTGTASKGKSGKTTGSKTSSSKTSGKSKKGTIVARTASLGRPSLSIHRVSGAHQHLLRLRWTASGDVLIERNGQAIRRDSAHGTFSVSLRAATYRVCTADAPTVCSAAYRVH